MNELFAKVDRKFFESWLLQLNDILKNVNENSDPTFVSFICQLALLTCLEEFELMPTDEQEAQNFCLETIKKIWIITPIGAQKLLENEQWEILKNINRQNENSAWYNLHVTAAISELKYFIKDSYQIFPKLSEDDRDFLADKSPVIQQLKNKNEIEPDLGKFLGVDFIDAFQSAQMEAQLGSVPTISDSFEKALDYYETSPSARMTTIISRANPILVAHKIQLPDPPNISHNQIFEQLITEGAFSTIWKETVQKVCDAEVDLEIFKEFVLKSTFPLSYEFAYQILTCDEFTSFQENQTSDEFSKTCSFLIRHIEQTYSFISSTSDKIQKTRLICKNPTFIYLALQMANEFINTTTFDKEEKIAIEYFKSYLQKNLSAATEKVVARSNFTYFSEALAEMESNGELIGVISHEIAHVIDQNSENFKEHVIEMIAKYKLTPLPEDYAKWGEHELFADIVALIFLAGLQDNDDIHRRNRLIQVYARKRRLRKGLYAPLLIEPIVELGSHLKNSIVVQRLAEEYEHVMEQVCSKCGSSFNQNVSKRKSFVIYRGRPHDILRFQCSKCNATRDFYFDFLNTMLIPKDKHKEAIKQMIKIYGEITGPIPDDFFSEK